MEFLCWVNRCLFPDDLADDLRGLGLDDSAAAVFKMACRERVDKGRLDILSLYQDHCVGSGSSSVAPYLKQYIANMHLKWNELKSR